MTSKVQPALERSASFNRADINCKGHRERENVNDNETLDNRGGVNPCLKTSAHHRHTSLGGDSHSLALYPINLNSNIYQLHSPQLELSDDKASIKASILSDPSANKNSTFASAPPSQNEDEVAEPPEELSLEPHETLLQDAQEEALSASYSVDSRSPREEQDFILWGNAAFCLSEGRDSTGSIVNRQGERVSEESKKDHSQICEQKQNTKHLQLPSKHGGLLSFDHITKPENYHVATVVSSVTCNTHQASLAEGEENVRHPSSFGSIHCVHDPATTISATRQIQQAQAWEDSSKGRSLVSSDAQSCCLDFDAQELEASSASDSDGEVKGSKTISEHRKDERIATLADAVKDEWGASSTFPDMDLHKDKHLVAHEEVKIRAELELEIERDLEQELKTKIYLLTRRLEELHVLKATRHPKQEQSAIEEHASAPKDDTSRASKGTLTKLSVDTKLTEDNVSKRQLSLELSTTALKAEKQAEKNMEHHSSAQSKKQLANAENEVHLSYINTPVTNWKRFAMASGWVPENKSQPPLLNVGLKHIKIPKNSIEEPASIQKSKVKADGTSSFKPDYQTWTTLAASSKKFDWIRTLRLEVPSTPRVSTMKLGSGSPKEKSATASAFKERLRGSVMRNLFGEDARSTTAKAVPKLHRKETGAVLPIGNKRSTLGTCNTTMAMAESASVKRVGERPAVPVTRQARLVQKTPDDPTRRARTTKSTTKPTSVPRVSPPQASSGKVGKIDRTTGVRVPPPSKQASTRANNVSAAYTDKVKRSAGTVPSSNRSVTSKGVTTATPSKASTKQASFLPKLSKSRVPTSPKITSSATRVQEEKLLTHSTKPKAPGALTRGKVTSKR